MQWGTARFPPLGVGWGLAWGYGEQQAGRPGGWILSDRVAGGGHEEGGTVDDGIAVRGRQELLMAAGFGMVGWSGQGEGTGDVFFRPHANAKAAILPKIEST